MLKPGPFEDEVAGLNGLHLYTVAHALVSTAKEEGEIEPPARPNLL